MSQLPPNPFVNMRQPSPAQSGQGQGGAGVVRRITSSDMPEVEQLAEQNAAPAAPAPPAGFAPHPGQMGQMPMSQVPMGQAPSGQYQQPIQQPVSNPSLAPSMAPTMAPQMAPTMAPNMAPAPSPQPTATPQAAPAMAPSMAPQMAPSVPPQPSAIPQTGFLSPPQELSGNALLHPQMPQPSAQPPSMPLMQAPDDADLRSVAKSVEPPEGSTPDNAQNGVQNGSQNGSQNQTQNQALAQPAAAGIGNVGPAPVDREKLRYHKMEFTGTGGQYLGLLITNFLLMMITIGIYYPWAKVREKRFFMGNARIDGDGFDYLASGMTIFKGRALAIVALVVIAALEVISPWVQLAALLGFMIAWAWMFNKSLRFNARNLAWRGVRLDWHGSYMGAIVNFALWPFLGLLTLGLLAPMASQRIRGFIAQNHSFGTAEFRCELSSGDFYLAAMKTILFCLLLLTIIASIFAAVIQIFYPNLMGDFLDNPTAVLMMMSLDENMITILYIAALGVAGAFALSGKYYFALARALILNNLSLPSGVVFRSRLTGSQLAFIELSNLILNILTLGFYYTWGVVRRYRLLVESTELRYGHDLKGFVDTERKASSAFGAELAEMEGVGMSI